MSLKKNLISKSFLHLPSHYILSYIQLSLNFLFFILCLPFLFTLCVSSQFSSSSNINVHAASQSTFKHILPKVCLFAGLVTRTLKRPRRSVKQIGAGFFVADSAWELAASTTILNFPQF